VQDPLYGQEIALDNQRIFLVPPLGGSA